MKKSLCLIILGSILEYYDFAIYIYFAKSIGSSLIPVHDQLINLIASFSILAIGALFRPLGGIIIANFGDAYGRKNVFIYTLLLMAIPTLLIAFIPSSDRIGILAPILLITLRCIQGLAIGGEIPGSIVYAYEMSQTKNKALNTNIVVAGTNIGFFIASISGAILIRNQIGNFEPWRVAFFLGGVFGIASFIIRRYLQETPEFINYQNFIKSNPRTPCYQLLIGYRTQLLQIIAFGGFVAVSLAVYSFFMPSYLNMFFNFPMAKILQYNSYSLFIFIISAFIAGKWHYLFGKYFLISSILIFNLVNFLLFTHYQQLSLEQITFFNGIVIFYIGIICGRLPVLSASFFPVHVRYSGVALSYNISLGIIAGLTQVLLLTLIKFTAIIWLPAVYIMLFSIPALIFIIRVTSIKLI